VGVYICMYVITHNITSPPTQETSAISVVCWIPHCNLHEKDFAQQSVGLDKAGTLWCAYGTAVTMKEWIRYNIDHDEVLKVRQWIWCSA